MSTGIVGGYHTYNILEALLATLNQLAQAPTLFAIGPTFGYYEECMSECINYFTYFLIKDTTELGKLEDLSQWAGLFAESADAFSAKGMPFTNTALLIDGKLFKTGSSVNTEVEHTVKKWKSGKVLCYVQGGLPGIYFLPDSHSPTYWVHSCQVIIGY